MNNIKEILNVSSKYWFISSLHVCIKSLICEQIVMRIRCGVLFAESLLIAQFLTFKIHSFSVLLCVLVVEFCLKWLKSPQIDKSLTHNVAFCLKESVRLRDMLQFLTNFGGYNFFAPPSDTFDLYTHTMGVSIEKPKTNPKQWHKQSFMWTMFGFTRWCILAKKMMFDCCFLVHVHSTKDGVFVYTEKDRLEFVPQIFEFFPKCWGNLNIILNEKKTFLLI